MNDDPRWVARVDRPTKYDALGQRNDFNALFEEKSLPFQACVRKAKRYKDSSVYSPNYYVSIRPTLPGCERPSTFWHPVRELRATYVRYDDEADYEAACEAACEADDADLLMSDDEAWLSFCFRGFTK